jgi:hypothetical protein
MKLRSLLGMRDVEEDEDEDEEERRRKKAQEEAERKPFSAHAAAQNVDLENKRRRRLIEEAGEY